MEDSASEGGLNCGSPAQEGSESKNFRMCPRDGSCDILVKNVAAFCSCPKILPEAKFNIFGRGDQSSLVLTVLCAL